MIKEIKLKAIYTPELVADLENCHLSLKGANKIVVVTKIKKEV